jgi:alpha-aminoadipic semialdehyde synthase
MTDRDAGLIIGIRREDKNVWERRAPLVPDDVAALRAMGVRLRVQPDANRIFDDAAYRRAGAEVTEDLGPCGLVLAVKEIPLEHIAADTAYVFFAHVVKGQAYNMPLLQRLLDLRTSLIDYERIRDAQGRRLIFFSRHAGQAGMIDTLWTLGQRLRARGVDSPLADVRQAFRYGSFGAAADHLRDIGTRLAAAAAQGSAPLVIGVTGYGNVARGCHEVLDCLPVAWTTPERLAADAADPAPVRCVEFREQHMARRRDGGAFDLAEYYAHPERYTAAFEPWLDHIDVLVNTIYWEPRYPRLVTRDWARRHPAPRLEVIGDISCDIEGSVELTLTATMPDAPSYTWDREADRIRTGVEGPGPAIMAVDNLPCELARESSEHFSSVLREMVPALARCDWAQPFDALDLPPELHGGLIVHRGDLTPAYEYLSAHLAPT